MAKMQMCKINHTAVKVGSIVRSSGFGSRLMVVTAINNNNVTLKTFGRTLHGKFIPAVKPRTIKGTINAYGPKNMYKGHTSVVAVAGTFTYWYYQHVTILFKVKK